MTGCKIAMYASFEGHSEELKYLIDFGATLSQTRNAEHTAVQLAQNLSYSSGYV